MPPPLANISGANGNSSFQGTFRLLPEITLGGAPLVLSFNFDFQGNLAITPGDPRQGFSVASSEVYLTTAAFSGASLVNVSGTLAFVAGVATGGGTYTDILVRTGLFGGDAGSSVSHSSSLPVALTSRYNYGTLALFLNCTATSSSSSAASCDFSQALSLGSITIEQGGLGGSDFYVNFDGGPSIPVSASEIPNPSPALTSEPQTLIPVSLGGLLLAGCAKAQNLRIVSLVSKRKCVAS